MVHDIRKSIEISHSAQVSLVSPSNSLKVTMNMAHWWNNTDRANPMYWEENLSQSHLSHHKTHGLVRKKTRASALRYRPLTS